MAEGSVDGLQIVIRGCISFGETVRSPLGNILFGGERWAVLTGAAVGIQVVVRGVDGETRPFVSAGAAHNGARNRSIPGKPRTGEHMLAADKHTADIEDGDAIRIAKCGSAGAASLNAGVAVDTAPVRI